MSLARLSELATGAVLFGLACGGDGGGGGTQPPGPPTQMAISGGNQQSWYKNNPLPEPYAVTVRDASNRAVPDVTVDWTITGGGDGTLSNDPSRTNASGVATTTHNLGSANSHTVIASLTDFPTVPSATFTTTASVPPTSAAVAVQTTGANSGSFSPQDAVVQVNGTVTWTWSPGGIAHNVTYTSGPTPVPSSSGTQASGTHSNTITTVGRYAYTCTLHSGMNGTVTVVN